MVQRGGLAQDYVEAIAGGGDEVAFLESIPWVIDAGTQELGPLLRSLRFEATRLAELPDPPCFSLIAPLRCVNSRLIDEMILSVRCQSWTRWELLIVESGESHSISPRWDGRDPRISVLTLGPDRELADAREQAFERATGDFVAFLDPGEVLHPSALGAFARRLSCDRSANLIYSNEAVLDEGSDRISGFYSKPYFDPFTLLRIDCVGHLAAIRRDLLTAAKRDGRVSRTRYRGVEDHELYLRLAWTGRVRSIHLPLFLSYRRTLNEDDPGVAERRLRLVEEMADEFFPGSRPKVVPPIAGSPGIAPSVKFQATPGRIPPRLLVIVPFKDHVDQTLRCVESIEQQAHDLDVRVILVDNLSLETETGIALKDWINQPRRCRYAVVEHDGPFNYARINNAVVHRFGDDSNLILFLNNDVELHSRDCFQTMAMQLLADDRCGAVGIRLMYPDSQEVQHGGMKVTHHLIGSGYLVIGHSTEAREFVFDERIAFGVTFACAMIRRSLFEELGGLEEVMMPNAFGDVDFCARAIEAGYRHYYFGSLVGTHGESKSRGRSAEDVEFTTLHERHGQVFADWRLRNLSRGESYTWPLLAISPEALVTRPESSLLPLPLRYRVADRVNLVLKHGLGPMHGLLRDTLVHLWRSFRKPGVRRVGPATVVPAVRRPFLLRREESRQT